VDPLPASHSPALLLTEELLPAVSLHGANDLSHRAKPR
jgi:hypothetical protein